MLQNTITSATIPRSMGANNTTPRISRLSSRAQARIDFRLENNRQTAADQPADQLKDYKNREGPR